MLPPQGDTPVALTCVTCHETHGNDAYRNLRADPRASLFVQEPAARNPQSSGRLALLGTLTQVPAGEMSEARDRYVAVHPEGRSFAELGDFLFWHMNVEEVHVVGGFAKAGWMSWQEFREASGR